MFRRKSAAHPVETPSAETSVSATGKGRPTPSRKQAEAAAKARAKASAKGARGGVDRAARQQSMERMRAALRTGDERYLPTRDKGPMRRFVRDFVDVKVTFSEWALPVVVLTLGAGFVSSASVARLVSNFSSIYILIVAINLVVLTFQLRRQLNRRFPGQSTRGLTWYLMARALQLRWIRQPRPQRRVGEQLPDTYR